MECTCPRLLKTDRDQLVHWAHISHDAWVNLLECLGNYNGTEAWAKEYNELYAGYITTQEALIDARKRVAA